MSPIRIISTLVGAVFTKEARHIGMDGCIICSEPLGDNTGETSQWWPRKMDVWLVPVCMPKQDFLWLLKFDVARNYFMAFSRFME